MTQVVYYRLSRKSKPGTRVHVVDGDGNTRVSGILKEWTGPGDTKSPHKFAIITQPDGSERTVSCGVQGMRRQYYQVTDDMIGAILKTKDPETMSVEGVPKDAKLISVHHDTIERLTYVVFEHESFDDLAEGMAYPPGPVPTFTVHYGDT